VSDSLVPEEFPVSTEFAAGSAHTTPSTPPPEPEAPTPSDPALVPAPTSPPATGSGTSSGTPPLPRKRPLPRVIAIANQKGGVGKTTTTVNLSAALAEQDHRVLVIDLDPQGNATTGLGIVARDLEYSIYDVLLNDIDLNDAIESTAVLNLFLAPASLDLAGAEIELVSVMSRETRLRRAIEQVKDDYDYILIDCPPSLGLLTVNALAGATEVLVPIQCEYYALEGLGQLMRNVNLVQRNLNPQLELSLIVLVMYDGRTKLGEQVATEVREHFGERVCRNVIPRNIRLSEAPSYGQPITVFDSSSTGAVAYRELAREVHNGSA
jgi:chromosome partitioning protein